MSNSKKDIRKKFLTERKNFSNEKVESCSNQIHKRLEAYLENFSKASNEEIKDLFLYSSINNEIDVFTKFADNVMKKNHDLNIYLPRCLEDSKMEFRKFKGLEFLEKDSYGIWVPKNSCELKEPDQHTLLAIPCVSVSREGYRIGYGAGYYDRYMSKYKQQLAKNKAVCLCYSSFVTADSYNDAWDQKIDVIITEDEILYT